MYMFVLFLYLFTIVNKVVLTVLFALQKRNKYFNRLFAAIIFSIIPLMISNLMHYLGIRDFIIRTWISLIIVMAYYPLNTLFIHESLHIKLKKGKGFYAYILSMILPFVVMLFIHLFVLSDEEVKAFTDANLYYEPNWLLDLSGMIISAVMFGHFIYYVFFLVKASTFVSQFEDGHALKKRYHFLKKYVFTLIGSSLFMAVGYFIFDYKILDTIVTPVVSNLMVFYMVYLAMDGSVMSATIDEFEVIKEKGLTELKLEPKKGLITDAQAEVIRDKVLDFFKNESYYLMSDFNLPVLSDKIDVPVYQISYTMNTLMETSFPKFLNEYRVKKAAELIQSDAAERVTMEGIAIDCGFGSKTSFYRHFKDFHGITPKEYLLKEKAGREVA